MPCAPAGAHGCLGALVVLLLRRGGDALGLNVFLSLSAGTMIAAAALSLLVPAVRLGAEPAAVDALLTAALGYAAFAALDRLLSQQHVAPHSLIRKTWTLRRLGSWARSCRSTHASL